MALGGANTALSSALLRKQMDDQAPEEGSVSYPKPQGIEEANTTPGSGGAPAIPTTEPSSGESGESGGSGPTPFAPLPDSPEPEIPESPNASPLAIPGTFARPGSGGAAPFRSPGFLANRIVRGSGGPVTFTPGEAAFGGASPIGGNGGRPLDEDLVSAILAGLRR